jgi:hypothetical protein
MSRQPPRPVWTTERFLHERSVALGFSIDVSTHSAYTSSLNSYITFCKRHGFPIDPTEETLSFFVVYMSTFIKPSSVNSYLSGICRQLEPFFPDVRAHRKSMLVSRTLTGCLRRFGTPTTRKDPLMVMDLRHVITHLRLIPDHGNAHDDLLFIAQILTGFTALLRLGELVLPDSAALHNYRKVSRRHTVKMVEDHFTFFLPGHKADRFYEGNTIVVKRLADSPDPLTHFQSYLKSRDHLFPYNAHLWLRSTGLVPTRRWFISRLREYFPRTIAGQSMRAGGATALAEAGVPSNVIQAVGRWASTSYQIYIRKNPVLLQALIFQRHDRTQNTAP